MISGYLAAKLIAEPSITNHWCSFWAETIRCSRSKLLFPSPNPGPISRTSADSVTVSISSVCCQSTNIASGKRACRAVRLTPSEITVVKPVPPYTQACAAIKIAPPNWRLPPTKTARPKVPLWLFVGRCWITLDKIAESSCTMQ